MVTIDTKKLPKNTYEISVKVGWSKIDEEAKSAFKELLSELDMPGFRKGKVPAKIGEKQIKKEAIYERLIRKYLPVLYQEVITKSGLKPVVSPKVEMVKSAPDADWEFKFTVAEKPEIVLGDYKKAVKDAKTKATKAEIWVPGKEPAKEVKKPDQSKLINEVLTALLTAVKCEISDLILEEEINRRLAKLVDDVQKIGLTVEKYLASSNLTMEKLKSRLATEVADTYKIEFILAEIADKESIKIEEADLDKIFAGITDEKERAEAKKNAYFYASIMRKQKAIEFLTSL